MDILKRYANKQLSVYEDAPTPLATKSRHKKSTSLLLGLLKSKDLDNIAVLAWIWKNWNSIHFWMECKNDDTALEICLAVLYVKYTFTM